MGDEASYHGLRDSFARSEHQLAHYRVEGKGIHDNKADFTIRAPFTREIGTLV